MNRTDLQEAYIHQLIGDMAIPSTNFIDGMDHKTMYQFVYDTLNDNLKTYSEAELITEVEDYYPELLEE